MLYDCATPCISHPDGPNGLEVSRLIAGFWRLKHWGMSTQARLSFIKQLLELGITTMDHAMVYGSEGLFGEALALRPSLRAQMEIVTKCGIRPVVLAPWRSSGQSLRRIGGRH